MKVTIDTQEKALYASLFPRRLTRAEKRKLEILEATIECYATLGIHQTTYEHIATRAKASRTLVLHYFPDREELTRLAIEFIRADMQNAAVKAIQSTASPEKQLKAYIKSTFEWTRQKPNYFTVWCLFLYYCGVRADFKEVHTRLASTGHERIVVMIQRLTHDTRPPTKNLLLRAKTLQALIGGAVFATHGETLTLDYDDFVDQTIRDCLRIAKGE